MAITTQKTNSCPKCKTPLWVSASGFYCPNCKGPVKPVPLLERGLQPITVVNRIELTATELAATELTTCRMCDGSGFVDCDECDGFGVVDCWECGQGTDCEACDDGEVSCSICNGTGSVMKGAR